MPYLRSDDMLVYEMPAASGVDPERYCHLELNQYKMPSPNKRKIHESNRKGSGY